MKSSNRPPWLEWTRKLQAIAQTGLNYARDPYDTERYTSVREVAAEMLAAAAGAEIGVVQEWIGKDTGYATPKIDVRGVVFQDDKILLVRERADGRWTLPGGWADVNESPSENVVREVCEEAGYHTRCVKLLAVFDHDKHPHGLPCPFHIYKLFFRCELTGGTSQTGLETDQVAFFEENSLPELSITRVTPGQIKRMYEHFRNPDLPADFD